MKVNRSGWGRVAGVYDVLMAPLEALWVRGWRRRVWQAAPKRGLGLEVGAGTGANLPCHPPGARVVMTDVSWRMLRRARERARRERNGDVAFIVADAQRLPFRDGTFEWGVATLVFCEVPEPVAGLRAMAGTLKPGGPILLLEHVRPGGALGRLAELLTRVTGPLWGEHWDRRTVDNARAAGLREVSAEPLLGRAVLLIRGRAP
ncbi:MAG: class I SAM-dependent methyltransferase [Gemmatimonadota bacterium]